ncbi:TetR/AcrR family transcriptional regulator [Nocardia sp. alder85J]|uniref:TetR/AcrR family transcriptional regulator n=1 Tax=Nocardia sp. alder85J TaxID=2862949 RepID=UPI001CD6EAC4|nr:TetR/AcrR family transcriptional regulator [Nocardia sp. alder85J]MCX4095011.1 TetR/AcrR family transcriptional regulator [Nocardia sp. alder85J]
MASPRTRLTAGERSEQVLAAAVTAFAESGYAATKTDEIARLAGVSQPYVIRLFGSKQQLFVDSVELVTDRIEEIFREAAAAVGPDADTEEKIGALGEAFDVFLTERELLMVLLHGFSASGDPAIGNPVRERFGRIYRLVRDLTGASGEQARDFMSTGMLLTVMTAMQVVGPDPVRCDWAVEILENLVAE